MARKVFFSFHYEQDVWRANVVRNSWVTKGDAQSAGFIDAAHFEEIKKGGDKEIKKWIDEQLSGTSVTVILIGAQTCKRKYVNYEVQKSYEKGNGFLGIYIHQIKNEKGKTSRKGSKDVLVKIKDAAGKWQKISLDYPVYDWVDDDGYHYIGDWVEKAATLAGR